MGEGEEDDGFDELVESLENITEHLDRSVNEVFNHLKDSGHANPYVAQDSTGRYIMLDGVAALANAKAALLNASL